MKNIVDYISEALYVNESANGNQVIFNACMELDNNKTIYEKQLLPLVKNLVKKHKDGKFDIKKLEESSVIAKLCQACLRAVKSSLTGEDRKRLTKFVTGCVIKNVENIGELTLTKEEEEYAVEWDYNNSEKCGW